MTDLVVRAKTAIRRGDVPVELVEELVEKVEAQAAALDSVRRWMHEGVDQNRVEN